MGKVDQLTSDLGRAQAEIAELKAQRDEAIKTIFQWTGCPECRYWSPGREWCKKHDREAASTDGCSEPVWRGLPEEGEQAYAPDILSEALDENKRLKEMLKLIRGTCSYAIAMLADDIRPRLEREKEEYGW